MTTIRRVSEDDIPLSMLLHADPSEACIGRYLPGSVCFGAFVADSLVGACVTNLNEAGVREIYNVVVVPERQKQGIGAQLLRAVINHFAEAGETKLELGTGTFGYQLSFYQRFGFRVEAVWRDHFVNNYPDPIHEDGIHLRDMLRLGLDLQRPST